MTVPARALRPGCDGYRCFRRTRRCCSSTVAKGAPGCPRGGGGAGCAARDLQQCADAVMRLQAGTCSLSASLRLIAFHPDPGKPRALTYHGASRADFNRYLVRVFAEAGSASLQAELPLAAGPVMPGDVLIQGGHPGHAVLVLDVAEGRRSLGSQPVAIC